MSKNVRQMNLGIRSLSLLAATVVVCVAWAGDKLTGKRTHVEAVIPLYLSSSRVLVMMRLGDHSPSPVVFDTGTNDNVLDTVYAEQFNLPRIGPSTSTDGSTGRPVPGYQTRLVGVQLGGIPIADAPANVFDYHSTDEVGIFGPNSFPQKLVLLDLRNAELRILSGSAVDTMDGPGAPYLGEGAAGLPSLQVELPSGVVHAILDTGNDSALLLPLEFSEKLSLAGGLEQIGSVVSASGSQPMYEAQIAGDIRIGAITVNNPTIRFIKGGYPNVGLPLLRQMTLAFDPTDGRTWVIDDTASNAARE